MTLNPSSHPVYDRYPYLVTHLDERRDHVRLLPEWIPADRLREVAVAQHRANEYPATLFLSGGEAVRLEDGAARPLGEPCPLRRIVVTGPLAGEVPLCETANLADRWRHFVAWCSCTLGLEPFLAKRLAEGKNGTPAPRSFALEAALNGEPNEVLRFLRVAHREAARNELFALPGDGSELLRVLSCYDSLSDAWRGGWLRKPWRAWLVEIACAGRLLTREAHQRVSRIHSEEAAQSITGPDFLGQAFDREFPDLFEHLDTRTLEGSTRETTISWVA